MSAENPVLPGLWREDLQELGPEEMEDVLTHQDSVHVGFAAGDERYAEGLLAAGKMVAWRIRPSSMTGVKTVQPDH